MVVVAVNSNDCSSCGGSGVGDYVVIIVVVVNSNDCGNCGCSGGGD